MGELRDRMDRDMLLKNLSDRTRKTYLACMKDFVRFHCRDPKDLGDEEIKALLHHLIVERMVSQSTVSQMYSALKFFYVVTLERKWNETGIPRGRLTYKLPVVLSKREVEAPLYSYHQDLFGQCWCLYEESDAMWRIYSPAKSGLRLESSVTKFNLFGEMERACLGMVVYSDTVQDLLKKAKSRESLFGEALYKRMAFQHEHEVRLLTHADFLGDSARGATHVTLPLKPADFIEGVTIDPRAEDWYVEAIVQYCKRAGLACTPVKSTLYEHDPHLKIGVTKRWVPVDRD